MILLLLLFAIASIAKRCVVVVAVGNAVANISKWTGGPYTTNAVVPEDSFSVTKGI